VIAEHTALFTKTMIIIITTAHITFSPSKGGARAAF
jgi:hypothetical protein